MEGLENIPPEEREQENAGHFENYEKMRKRGKLIVISVAILSIAGVISNLFTMDVTLGSLLGVALNICASIALIRGVRWIRYIFIVLAVIVAVAAIYVIGIVPPALTHLEWEMQYLQDQRYYAQATGNLIGIDSADTATAYLSALRNELISALVLMSIALVGAVYSAIVLLFSKSVKIYFNDPTGAKPVET